MEQNKTQREMLEDLQSSGVISSHQVDDIVNAPRWSFSIRELVTYLASLIIAAGVIRLLAIALEDASRAVIAIALYVVAVVAGIASWKLSSGSAIQQRFAEVLELAAIGATAGATGIILQEAEMKGEWIAVILTGAAAAWGFLRCRATRFSGTAAMSIGLVSFSNALGALINSENPMWGGVLMVAAGAILVLAGLQHIGTQQFARAVGSLYIIIGSMTIGTRDDWSRPAPIITGVILFAVAVVVLAPEMLVAGAFCIVAGVVMTVVEWVNNETAQGLVIIATGLVVLGVLTVQMKRAVNRPTPGTQVA